jgi:hypothetical protein
MKNFLRISGIAVLLVNLSVWIATGAHRGWTITTRTEWKTDPVTEIDFPVTHDTFVMGIELLAIGLVAGLALFGIGCFVGRRKPTQPSSISHA